MIRAIAILAAALAASIASAPAAAQAGSYPAKAIRFIVPFAPGGSADTIGRLLAQEMAKSLAQPVLVDNRPGGGGTIGVDTVAKAAPDGHTIGIAATGALAINVTLMKLPYDPLKDLAPVSKLADIPMVIVAHPASGIDSVKDLIARAKARPGSLAYGTTGVGSAMHLSGEMLKSITGVELVHIGYKGSAPAVVDVMAGQIPIAIVDLTSALPHVRSGRIKALATLGAQRTVTAPDLPTMAEAGIAGFDAVGWFGIVAPGGTPRDAIRKLNGEINRIMQLREIREKSLAAGAEPATGTAEEFGALIAAEIPKWGQAVRASGAKAN